VVALVVCDRTTCKRSNKAVHIALIIALLLERRLHIRNHLIGRQIVISVNRAVPGVIGIGIIAPGRIPVTCVPKIRGAENEYHAVVMIVPPVPIVPLRFVVAESSVTFALPVLASLNAPALLELHRRRLRGVGLFCNIEVLRLKWLRFCLGNIGFALFGLACCLSAGCTLTTCSRRRLCGLLFFCLLRSPPY
jgi:hypothetical protein